LYGSKTKSLLPPFTKGRKFPLFEKEGLGEIFTECSFPMMDSLAT
jgi:hypothetical protein